MTISLFLQQNLFDVDLTSENHDFPTFVRYYDDLALAAFFNQMTGEFYAVRFESGDEMKSYRDGEIKMSLKPVNESWCVQSGMIYREKINILPVVNLHTIETAKHLNAAFMALESMIDAQINNVSHHVQFGDRVVVHFAGERDQVATVVGMDAATIHVKLQSGGIAKLNPDIVERLELPFPNPGKWIESV